MNHVINNLMRIGSIVLGKLFSGPSRNSDQELPFRLLDKTRHHDFLGVVIHRADVNAFLGEFPKAIPADEFLSNCRRLSRRSESAMAPFTEWVEDAQVEYRNHGSVFIVIMS